MTETNDTPFARHVSRLNRQIELLEKVNDHLSGSICTDDHAQQIRENALAIEVLSYQTVSRLL